MRCRGRTRVLCLHFRDFRWRDQIGSDPNDVPRHRTGCLTTMHAEHSWTDVKDEEELNTRLGTVTDAVQRESRQAVTPQWNLRRRGRHLPRRATTAPEVQHVYLSDGVGGENDESSDSSYDAEEFEMILGALNSDSECGEVPRLDRSGRRVDQMSGDHQIMMLSAIISIYMAIFLATRPLDFDSCDF